MGVMCVCLCVCPPRQGFPAPPPLLGPCPPGAGSGAGRAGGEGGACSPRAWVGGLPRPPLRQARGTRKFQAKHPLLMAAAAGAGYAPEVPAGGQRPAGRGVRGLSHLGVARGPRAAAATAKRRGRGVWAAAEALLSTIPSFSQIGRAHV